MGFLADPLAAFSALLSQSAAWQAWTGAGDAAAALLHIFNDTAGPADPFPRAVLQNASRSVSKLTASRAVPFTGTANVLRVDFEAETGLGPEATAAEERDARDAFRASLDAVLAEVEDFVGPGFETLGLGNQGPVVFGGIEETDGGVFAARTFVQTIDVRWRDD